MPCILVVDGEPLQRQLICEILSTDPSLTFIEASGEAEALQRVRLYQPELIILDIYSPYCDEFSIYKQLHAASDNQDTPIIFTTAGLASNRKTYPPGNHPLIFKPFEEAELEAAVRQALRQSPAPVGDLTDGAK